MNTRFVNRNCNGRALPLLCLYLMWLNLQGLPPLYLNAGSNRMLEAIECWKQSNTIKAIECWKQSNTIKAIECWKQSNARSDQMLEAIEWWKLSNAGGGKHLGTGPPISPTVLRWQRRPANEAAHIVKQVFFSANEHRTTSFILCAYKILPLLLHQTNYHLQAVSCAIQGVGWLLYVQITVWLLCLNLVA